MLNILSIDGGGIRSVIPAALLKHIEEQTGKRIAEMFDLIVGTSTGGILAAGLAVKGAGGRPKYAAAELLDLYVKQGRDIFQRSFWKGITSVGGVADEQYDHAPLERLLKKYFGNATLKDVVKPVVLTAYDIERREPYFLKTTKANESDDRDHLLREAVRATTAAPTYFEPTVVKSQAKRSTRRVLVDGGVFVNNPALCAYVEAVKDGGDPAQMRVVSLGTGVHTRKISYEDAKDWGLAGWVRPIISVMMDGQADSADYHLRLLLPDAEKGAAQRYFRFDTELDVALDDMDAANAANIAALRAEAEQIVAAQKAEMDRLLAHFAG